LEYVRYPNVGRFRLRKRLSELLRKYSGSRPKRAWRSGENGQALVEFALILIPMLMLIFSIVSFGILFNNYVTLTDAVAYGARTLAINRGLGTGPPTACTVATTAITTSAANLTTSEIATTITFPSPDTSACANMVAGDTATVQSTYPCNLQILFFNVWPTCTLRSQTTVAIE
jgi:Flp pilus assembly protein TadG